MSGRLATMVDRAVVARSVLQRRNEERSVRRFLRLTKHFGQEGIGYPDGTWFVAKSEPSAARLERAALEEDDEIPWSVQCLDGIGPIIGKAALHPTIFLQIRSKYVQLWVAEDGTLRAGVDDSFAHQLAEMGIRLTRSFRDRRELLDIRRWC